MQAFLAVSILPCLDSPAIYLSSLIPPAGSIQIAFKVIIVNNFIIQLLQTKCLTIILFSSNFVHLA